MNYLTHNRVFPWARFPVTLRGAALVLVWALSACATSGDLEKVEQANQVQDQRLKSLEESIGKTLTLHGKSIEELDRTMKAFRGQVGLTNERTEQFAKEQATLTATLEKDTAERRKLTRQVEDQVKKLKRIQTETESEIDKLRLQLGDVEKLLKSSMAKLPALTEADKSFRKAFAMLLSGEFDLAADAFEGFQQAYPQDGRIPEALYRRGQAFFLIRKYDHALGPFFELVDKYAENELTLSARWMVARALEETGDLKLARELYGQLISGKTPYATDAARRVDFLGKLFSETPGTDEKAQEPEPKAKGKPAVKP
ncbi:MAG: hypothetical protein OEW39_01185 [Deltaproteobacteria bacterium]|nr:hypothetical protein [Deltaproteobacteria bacterium]